MRVYWFGLSALALVAIAPASRAQVIVIVEAKNNTNVSLRAGNSTSVSGWGNFEKELVAAGGTLRFSTKPRMFRGAEGAVELVTEAGERARLSLTGVARGEVRPRRDGFRAFKLAVLERGEGIDRKVPDLAHP